MIDLSAPGTLAIWSGGQLLAFSGIEDTTDYATHLVGRVAFEGVGILIKMPGVASLHFADGEARDVTLTGDSFEARTDAGIVRGAFLDAWHLLIDGPCRVREAGEPLRVETRGSRTLIGSAARFDAAKIDADLDKAIERRRRWLKAQVIPDDLPDLRRRTLIKALSVMKTQVCTPQGHVKHAWTTPDRWPHAGLWLWDSAFHAIGWRHVDLTLARDMLMAVLDGQRDDGQVPIRTVPGSGHEYTQPPVLALAAMLVDQIDNDPTWMADIYPRLCRYVQWDLDHRDSDGAGLVEWQIEGNPNCRSGESGMDNSPRFDSATPLDATDFNSFLALECEILAEIAYNLGRHEESAAWTEWHQQLCDLMNERLWNDEIGLYMDCDAATGAQTDVLANAGLLPLICGAASPRQAERLIEHLHDPGMFGPAVPTPSIALRDPRYRKDMWCGPVWVNINWLIALGLDRYDRPDLANEIRQRTLEEIERWYDELGVLFEFFDAEGETPPPKLHRKGRNDPDSPYNQVFFDYGWTATLYTDMVFTLSEFGPLEEDDDDA